VAMAAVESSRATDCCASENQEEFSNTARLHATLSRKARTLNGTAPWIERVGLSYVKQCALVDDAEGASGALVSAFSRSQKYCSRSVGAQARRGQDAHDFCSTIGSGASPEAP